MDLDGLVLAPGFIDIHTHYDAQILWDSDLTPSCWHGVTSVIMGNCGFGVAPTRPEHRDIIVRTLENVEGMSMEALNAGIDWCFETFPQYMSALAERGKRLNVRCLHRAHAAAAVRARRGGAGGDRGRGRSHGRSAAGGARRRRDRVLHLAAAGASGRVRQAGAEPVRRNRRSRAAHGL